MSSMIVGLGGPTDSQRLELATRKGTPVPNFRKLNRNPASLAEAKRIWTSKYPQIVNRSVDATYNCVGCVFAFRRTWIEDDHLAWLLSEDEYVEVKQPMPGDLIVYRDESGTPNHVGVILEVAANIARGDWDVRVLSQCGQDGEYVHAARDIPPGFGPKTTYHSERKT